MPLFAFSQNARGFKNWVQKNNLKNLTEMCQQGTALMKKACNELKVNDTKSEAKFKWSLISANVVTVSYGAYSTRVEKMQAPHTYSINRKLLDTGDIKSYSELYNEVYKRLPTLQSKLSLWLPYAEAMEMDSVIMGTAISLMLTGADEQEICQNAERAIESCEKFEAEALQKGTLLFQAGVQNMEKSELQRMKSYQELLKHTYEVYSKVTHLDQTLNGMAPEKKEIFNKCSCVNGTCSYQAQPSQLAPRYEKCKTMLKKARETADKVTPTLRTQISQYSEMIHKLEESYEAQPPSEKKTAPKDDHTVR